MYNIQSWLKGHIPVLGVAIAIVFSAGMGFTNPVLAAKADKPNFKAKRLKPDQQLKLRKEEEKKLAKREERKFKQQNRKLANYYRRLAKQVRKQGGDPTPLLEAAKYFGSNRSDTALSN